MIEEITSPPFLDDTAQEMVTKLQAIANNINNNAGQVSYSNTTSQLQAETVQTAIDEVKDITDTISSNLAQLAHYRCIAVYNTLVSVTNGEATFDITSLGLSEKPLFDVFPNSGDDARLNVNCNINSTTATSLAFKVSRWDGNGSYTHKPTTNARFIIFVYQPN